MPILKNRRLARFILKILLRLHNALYRYITIFAVVAEGRLHPKHRLMNYHAFFTDNIKEDENVLDIGCGNGFLSYEIAAKAKGVTAIDLSRDSIESAGKTYSRDNINYICGDACQYAFTDTFDVIVLSNVLEHIERRVDFLLKIKELSPRLLIRVPMFNRDWITGCKAEMGIEYRLDPTHCIEYTLESLEQELAGAGLEIEKASVQFGEIWAVVRKKK